MLIEYLNIPPVPEELIDPIEVILNGVPREVNLQKYGLTSFQRRDCNPKLDEWCQENIPFKVHPASYQLIYQDIPVHVDSFTKTNINYIIFAGGPNVITTVYAETEYGVPLTPLQSMCIEENRWHKIKVDQMHGIDGIEFLDKPRISIRLQVVDLDLDHELITI